MFGYKISRLVLAEIFCDVKCIFGHISIYKGDAAEIFKNIGDEYDDLLINIDVLCQLRLLKMGPLQYLTPSTV